MRDLSLCNVEPVNGYLLQVKELRPRYINEIRIKHIKVCENLLQAARDIVGAGKEEL